MEAYDLLYFVPLAHIQAQGITLWIETPINENGRVCQPHAVGYVAINPPTVPNAPNFQLSVTFTCPAAYLSSPALLGHSLNMRDL